MTDQERFQISVILRDRANEIARHKERDDLSFPAAVAEALSMEISRLRGLADAVMRDKDQHHDNQD